MNPSLGDRRLQDTPVAGTQPDRPLLELVLAHQRRVWKRGGRVHVENYFALQPELRGQDEMVLDLIYNEVLLREETGDSPQVAEYVRRFPHLAAALELQFEVERNLRLELLRSDPGLTVADTPRPPTSVARPSVPDYEILGELGRGGMGVVYKARQLRLNRVVALKMILTGDHASPEASARFLAEAEAVARLHHPHIVQVFAFGEHECRPYFEMEYVGGGSLADRLDGRASPPREAARLVETLARAAHEVHRLGIVHRDLKPANVLLTADGVPKLADFGLAKWLDVESGLTRTDHVLGSPSYMAPEQAGGGAGTITPATDVYALGAILYELLTGRPPFRGRTVLETLELVKDAEPVAPRQLEPKLPRDLETICLKCLRKEPAGRYEGADALADDLKRFEAGESIRARRASTTERVWRWCRREPALAALALALCAGLAGVGTQWWRAESHLVEARRLRELAEASFRQQIRANRELYLANQREQTARRHAQGRFDAAMRALEGFESIARDAALLSEPRLAGLRADLLRTALRFNHELQESLEDDASPDARTQLSAAYSRIADISWELGLREDALATHLRSLALIEQMAMATPLAPELPSALARSLCRVGFTLRTMGRSSEALPFYERARTIQEQLAHDDPAVAQHRESLSWTLSNLGLLLLERDRLDDAARLHRQAIAIHEALVARAPGHSRYHSDLAWARRYLAQTLAAAGDRPAALRLLGAATDCLEDLLRSDPGEIEDRWRLARCRDEIGIILLRSARPAEAAAPLALAAKVHEALALANPHLYRDDLVRNCLYTASQRSLICRPEEALATLRRAEGLLGQPPQVLRGSFYELAGAYAVLGGSGPERSAAEPAPGLDRAMYALRRAVAAGYDDVAQLRRDPLLDPLRHRRDFAELLMDLAFPADPFQPLQ